MNFKGQLRSGRMPEQNATSPSLPIGNWRRGGDKPTTMTHLGLLSEWKTSPSLAGFACSPLSPALAPDAGGEGVNRKIFFSVIGL